MKRLAITSVAVLIVLIGFTAILVCLPCGDGCFKEKTGSREMNDSKCSGEKETCGHEGKCSEEKSGCEGNMDGGHEGCSAGNEKGTVKEWTDADGKCHKEMKVSEGGDGMSCPMENADHSGCCGCCPWKNGGGNHHCNGDSAGSDSVRIKVRGKL